MRMRSQIAAVLAPVVLGSAAVASEVAFDGHRAHVLVEHLASDGAEGRKSGLPAGERAEAFAAEQLAAAGVQPGGEAGTFFQAVPLLATEERGATLELLDSPYGPIEFLYGNDFTLVTNSGSGEVTAEVVLVGHGLCDLRREWDDYGDTDVTGRIALILRGSPDNGHDWEQAATRDSTLHEAVRRGAAAVLFCQGAQPVHGGAIHDGSYFPEMPVAYIGHRVLELLLVNTGRDREGYAADLERAPSPLATNKRLRLRSEVVRIADAQARNVIGRIPGADPRLREEIVLIGAHLDHLGTDGRGLVYKGANDNASGAAVLLELAGAFAARERPSARTLVFAAFAGEEQGLLGSEHLATHPTFAAERVVMMINFDMVGHGTGEVGIGGGEYHPRVWEAFRAGLDPALADSLIAGRAWGGEGSDHAPFRRTGMPVCNIWSEGDHRFYHSIEDDAAWVEPRVLGAVGRMAERWIGALADWPEPLAGEHRAGRALLYASQQIDFDGVFAAEGPPNSTPAVGAPAYLCGCVRWFDAEEFARPPYLDAVAALVASSEEDVRLVDRLSDVRGATRGGRRAAMIGLRLDRGRVPAERLALVGDLHVAFVRCDAELHEDEAWLQRLSEEGAAFLVPADTALVRRLPAGARRAVRLWPGRGDRAIEPQRFGRAATLFVVSLADSIAPGDLAATLRALGWDRTHLDLTPWLARGVAEDDLAAFLERLQVAGEVEHRRMRALLGGNLERL